MSIALARRAFAAARRLSGLARGEQPTLLVLAVGIGLAAGLTVSLFYRFIDLIQRLVLQGPFELDRAGSWIGIPLVVLLGLVAARALVTWGARGSDGENVADVMYRVNMHAGQLPFAPVLFKTLAAGTLIGTGGSVGAEGPVIVAGAATASGIGRWLRASPNRLRTLAGCGAAAGLSAAFNAPIAGVIFGIEKILGSTGDLTLGPFVVASIVATAVGRALFGNQPVLALTGAYTSGSLWDMLVFVLLGLACGVAAVVYSRGLWRTHDWLARRPVWLRLAVAAAGVGALDVLFRADLWGHGHAALDLTVIGERGALVLFGLAAAKLVATALTLGAGGAGGVFMPALFIGATLGGAVGTTVQRLAPALELAPVAVALGGMAGVVAGATHAPLTAIIMVLEMTGDYELILPLMLTGVLAYAVARRLSPESVYTEWLARRGIHLTHGADAAVLARLPVAECVNRQVPRIPEDASLVEVQTLLAGSTLPALPVVSEDGSLVGMIAPGALRDVLLDPALRSVVIAADLAEERHAPLRLDDSLLTALRLFGRHEVDVLPVLTVQAGRRLVGVIARQDAWAVYERHLVASQA